MSADISFPSDKLRVLSISQVDSIVNFWVQNPSFSNAQTTGDVLLQGVILSPGFLGTEGDVVNIVFQAVASGTAPVSFLSGSILASDGKGTNILASMPGASFTIGPAQAQTSIPRFPSTGSAPPPAALTSGAAVTSVPSIGDDTWYSFNNIQFNWSIPIGADGVWYTLSSSSNMVPSVVAAASPKTSASYGLASLKDGVWYFLISSETNGIWSPVAKKTIRLDRTPPEPFAITRTDSDPADTQMTFTWATTDLSSGLSRYEIKIGDGSWIDPANLQRGSSYIIPESMPGKRTLAVRAIDNAGNIREEDTAFIVVPPDSWQEWWYQMVRPSSFSIIALALIVAIFLLIYYLFAVRRELREFNKELHEKIGSMASEGKMERLKEKTEEKVEDIDKLTGEK